MTGLKLCIFPNDPIISYYEKGEIKERYYNPHNFFDEVHIISFIEKDIEESKVQMLVGNAKLKIHCVGKINLKNRSKYVKRVLELVRTINPDVIRAYNPLLEGWFAAKCSSELRIPLFLSLHTQYDHNRELMKKSNLKKYLALKYTEKFVEPFVLKTAQKITIVYRIIEPYVIKHGGKNPELLYNRINYEQFSSAVPINSLKTPLIISVGSLIEAKNHQCIIKAMKEIDAHCLIIGNGNLYDKLMSLIEKENLTGKVTIKRSVPNNEIQNYYKSAKVFALAYDTDLEGLPMPVIESMATGLPVVIPFPKKEYSDGLEGIALFSEREPSSFAENINRILHDSDLQNELSLKSLKKSKNFDNSIIEKREAEIYSQLVRK